MRPHRLSRLTLLTQGLALIGIGAGESACHKEPMVNGPDPDLHINAPPTPMDAAPDPTPNAADAGVTLPINSNRPTMNAPPMPPPHTTNAPPTGPKT
jgi:hypothetical protein